MNVLLTGASGFIGRNLSMVLAAAGHRVRPLSRRHGQDFSRMLELADWLPQLAGIEVVINCVGIIGERGSQRFERLHHRAPAALFRACIEAGVGRVVQISALGADDQAFTAFHLSKRAADDVLRAQALEGFVLRPGLVYGRGGASAGLMMRLAALPAIPVIGDGGQPLQPVHIADLAATVLRCLASPHGALTLDVIGPETYTLAQWLALMRAAQQLPGAPLLRIPVGVALRAARLVGRVVPMLNADTLRMLQAARPADVGPLVAFLGRSPRPAEARLFLADALSAGHADVMEVAT